MDYNKEIEEMSPQMLNWINKYMDSTNCSLETAIQAYYGRFKGQVLA